MRFQSELNPIFFTRHQSTGKENQTDNSRINDSHFHLRMKV